LRERCTKPDEGSVALPEYGILSVSEKWVAYARERDVRGSEDGPSSDEGQTRDDDDESVRLEETKS
jgi:hypothetical protein